MRVLRLSSMRVMLWRLLGIILRVGLRILRGGLIGVYLSVSGFFPWSFFLVSHEHDHTPTITAAANGEVAPFMGHNAFLRWRALQDAASLLPPSPSAPSSSASSAGSVPSPQIWSENNVSEDFDVALRLMLKGYTIRWATYSEGGFREGVSLSADDELNRWMKYAWGCNE